MSSYTKNILSILFFLIASFGFFSSTFNGVFELIESKSLSENISKNHISDTFHYSNIPVSDADKIREFEVVEIEEQQETNSKESKKSKSKSSYFSNSSQIQSISPNIITAKNIHPEFINISQTNSGRYISFSKYIGYI